MADRERRALSRFLDYDVSGDMEAVAPRVRKALARIGRVTGSSSENAVEGTVMAHGLEIHLTIEWKPSVRPGATLVCLKASSGGASGRAADSALHAWIDAYRMETERQTDPKPPQGWRLAAVGIVVAGLILLALVLWLRS